MFYFLQCVSSSQTYVVWSTKARLQNGSGLSKQLTKASIFIDLLVPLDHKALVVLTEIEIQGY